MERSNPSDLQLKRFNPAGEAGLFKMGLKRPSYSESVAVRLALEGTLNGHADVVRLLIAELVDFDTDFGQVQTGNLLVQVLGQSVHAVLVLVRVVSFQL